MANFRLASLTIFENVNLASVLLSAKTLVSIDTPANGSLIIEVDDSNGTCVIRFPLLEVFHMSSKQALFAWRYCSEGFLFDSLPENSQLSI